METDNTANAVPAIPVHSKPIRKARPTTVYQQAIRTVRKAAELVGGMDGCDEAQGQLVGFADQLHHTLEEMKAAKKASKKAGKTGKKMAADTKAEVQEI
jgi:hypothetical protein